MYIANLVFFSHKNQLDPPSIAEDGKLCTGNKAKLLECIEEKHVTFGMSGQPSFDCQIIDGRTLLNTLPTTGAITFHDFTRKIFLGLFHIYCSLWSDLILSGINTMKRASKVPHVHHGGVAGKEK